MKENRELLILAIETSTRAGSVSLTRAQQVLGAVLGDGSASHSIGLIENIDRILREGDASLSDVGLFAVAVGPGSFTGLRIGLATVKAFAVCAQKPCAAVSTLAAVAHGAGDSEMTVAMLPAGRGEVYAQSFSVHGEVVRSLDDAAHLKPIHIVNRYAHARTSKFAGEGTDEHIETFRRCAIDSGVDSNGWTLATRPEYLANSVAALALFEYRDGRVMDPAELRANYVRASDAEINERWRQQK